MKTLSLFTCIFFLLLQIGYGNGIGIIDGSNNTYLQVQETHTSVRVTDQIAIITSTQVFKNTSGSITPFKYGFPLKEISNPINLRWYIGGEWKTAEVTASEQDSTIPGGEPGEEIDPNLLDYLGDYPMFFTPSDTLGIDSTITMEITYVELLPYFLGKVSFFQRNNYNLLQPGIVVNQQFDFTLITNRPVVNATLVGLDDANVTITSEGATINYALEEASADFDYLVEYELASEGLGINALSTFLTDSVSACDDIRDGYFTFIIEPESSVDTEVIEKNFTLIIDRSGSMSGDKIVQARDAATFIVQNLNIGDKFNIVDFSSDVESFAPAHVDYTLENENNALSYIDLIIAGGSTNISEALTTAIQQFGAVDPDKANIIIFFTDGEATAGVTDTPGILEIVTGEILANETSVFLFTFGVGESTNQALLTLLAQENSGIANFIEPENLEEDLTNFFLSINNPVLLNTVVSFSPDLITDVHPFPFPNLYQGQQLIVSGRYTEADDLNVYIEGQAFNVPVTYDFSVSLADTSNIELSFLPKIWAKQKIDALQLAYYLADQPSAQLILDEIDSLSTCYGVVELEFSSFEDTTVETDELVDGDLTTGLLTVFPSPFSDRIQIKIPDALVGTTANLSLFNAQGQRVIYLSSLLLESILTVEDLEVLPPGIYFCQLEVDGKIYLAKISKS
jgi:Ca-activated chloride channel family protein